MSIMALSISVFLFLSAPGFFGAPRILLTQELLNQLSKAGRYDYGSVRDVGTEKTETLFNNCQRTFNLWEWDCLPACGKTPGLRGISSLAKVSKAVLFGSR